MSAQNLVSIFVNGAKLQVPKGTTILQALKKLDITVPTLCYHGRLTPQRNKGNCRLCLVEIGDKMLKPSCVTVCEEGMKIKTNTEKVNEGVKFNLSLMLADHPMQCPSCEANGRCEFQSLLYKYGVTHPNYAKPEDHTDGLQRNMDLCLNCGRCVTMCNEVQGMGALSFTERGRSSVPSTFNNVPLDKTPCVECGQCASVCPVGAIVENSCVPAVLNLLDNKQGSGKVVICQTAPAVRVAVGEELGIAPGKTKIGQVVASLKALGFDYVFDTTFTADLCIMEEGTELIERLNHGGKMPMFTSCCPAWITLVEKLYPEFIPNLSSCRSPQGMSSALIKGYWAKKLGKKPSDIVVVSIMPCTAKKHEAARKELTMDGIADTDYVLTTRELGKLLRLKKISMSSLPDNLEYDNPLGMSTGAGAIFGATGGVMEAAARTAYEITTGNKLDNVVLEDLRGFGKPGMAKSMKVTLMTKQKQPIDVNLAVVHGIGNAKILLEKIKKGEAKFDFIEVMACPGGCIGGGGQPKSQDPNILKTRLNAIYTIDEQSTLRKSHENPYVLQLYKEFLGAPLGHLSHELLHTHYNDRSKELLQ